MNILPHKSWHVRTKKNIARVRRDEEKARKEEEELAKKISRIDHEAKINFLKRKAGLIENNNKKTPDNQLDRFELFEDIKSKIDCDSGKNLEKKIEQEKWEVKTGIFSYLDGRYKYDHQKNSDCDWYLKSHEKRMNIEADDDKADRLKEIKKDDQIKLQNDPLETIKSYLNEINKNDLSSEKYSIKEQKNPHKSLPVKSNEQKEHFKRKKRKKKRKHSSDSSDDEDGKERKKILIEKLRLERLNREKKERQRTFELLNIQSTSSSNQPIPGTVNGGHRQKYNSQFNPHLARQNYD